MNDRILSFREGADAMREKIAAWADAAADAECLAYAQARGRARGLKKLEIEHWRILAKMAREFRLPPCPPNLPGEQKRGGDG